MSKEKYAAFISEVIRLTKEAQIKWEYLDEHKTLYENMKWTRSSATFLSLPKTLFPAFNTEDSFCCRINGTNVVLLVEENEPATLFVVPPTFKKVVKLSADEYGEQITRLLNLVQTQFPDGEKFIDDLLIDKTE